MPNQPKTPNRVVRVADDEWDAFGKITGRERSEVIRKFIRWYVGKTDELPPRPKDRRKD